MVSSPGPREAVRSSPDPASHTRNEYDATNVESALDETEEDDMDYEPPEEDSEEYESFESAEDADGDFEGTTIPP